jgi:hypothetical protein
MYKTDDRTIKPLPLETCVSGHSSLFFQNKTDPLNWNYCRQSEWPDEFLKKIAPKAAQHIFVEINILHTCIYRGKSSPHFLAMFVLLKKYPKQTIAR